MQRPEPRRTEAGAFPHHGVVARYHRWPYRHYVVVVNDIPTEVRPEFVRADD